MNPNATKLRAPSYYEREILRYDKKLRDAKNPTQRNYAFKMKRAAEDALRRATGDRVADPSDPDVLDLDKGDYEVIAG